MATTAKPARVQETAARTDVGVDAGVNVGVVGVGAESEHRGPSDRYGLSERRGPSDRYGLSERRGLSDHYGLSDRSAAFTTLLSNMARVIGPIPPGFGER